EDLKDRARLHDEDVVSPPNNERSSTALIHTNAEHCHTWDLTQVHARIRARHQRSQSRSSTTRRERCGSQKESHRLQELSGLQFVPSEPRPAPESDCNLLPHCSNRPGQRRRAHNLDLWLSLGQNNPLISPAFPASVFPSNSGP